MNIEPEKSEFVLKVYQTVDGRKFHSQLSAESCMGAIGRVTWVDVTTEKEASSGIRYYVVGEQKT